jgi:HK97 family phage prohead protease
MAVKTLHTKAEVVRKGIDADKGVIPAVVGSTNVLDRMGDKIDQSGWDLKYYKKTNPTVLWGHNIKTERPPIGKALKVWIENRGKKDARLMFKIQFDLQDNFASEIFRKVKEGFINTVSVGFNPVEWEEIETKKESSFGGKKYTKQELLELSFVPVPANPEASVILRTMSKEDERFKPVKLEDLYKTKKASKASSKKKTIKKKKASIKGKKKKKKDSDVKTGTVKNKTKVKKKGKALEDESVVKPYPNTHSCRIKSPGLFKKGSFRSMSRTHKGKKYQVIMGRLKGKTTMTDQSYRYKKSVWDKASASSHCKSHKGTFEAASETSVKQKEAKEKRPKDFEIKKIKLDDPKEAKGVIPYKNLGKSPESEGWDGPGEIAKAEVSDLKMICTWYDGSKPDVKSSYKLPHHKAKGHSCVWRGVAAAMGALLGARGGVKIPSGDRKAVYSHLKKHYKQFDKEAPDFKMVEDQVLANLDEEVHALTLEREDKYMVRLIKKVLKRQKKKPKTEGITKEQTEKALRIIDMALSIYKESSIKGGEKEER